MLVVAGPGNNGGDGFVAARLLAAAGRPVTLALLGDPARLRGDAAIAFARWEGATIAATPPLPAAAVVIDALFGAGLDRPVTGPTAALVAAMNAGAHRSSRWTCRAASTATPGPSLGDGVRAAATVTFFRRKPGHLL